MLLWGSFRLPFVNGFVNHKKGRRLDWFTGCCRNVLYYMALTTTQKTSIYLDKLGVGGSSPLSPTSQSLSQQ